jgi:hypothetical protein
MYNVKNVKHQLNVAKLARITRFVAKLQKTAATGPARVSSLFLGLACALGLSQFELS